MCPVYPNSSASTLNNAVVSKYTAQVKYWYGKLMPQ